jgi:hypothetical protein
MFPGSLQLGKWRLRGADAGQAVLERFDDDGVLQTGGWTPVTSFAHDPDTNGAAIESEAVRTDTLRPLSQAADAAVRCEGHLVCTDRFTANGIQMANGSVVIPGMLTVGGVNVTNAIAASEPSFVAVAPLQKVINLQTAQVELRVDTTELGGSPFSCAGKVAADGIVLTRKGQRPNFTVVKDGTGLYSIVFESVHPDGANYVASANAETFHEWIVFDTSTSTGFQLGIRNSSNQVIGLPFCFTVLA